MTIAAQQSEMWKIEEGGAPEGPDFEVRVESKSEPGKVYRIARGDGHVYHVPACPAFTHRRRCRHMTYAFALSERPEAMFMRDILAEWAHLGGDIASGDNLHRWWTFTFRLAAEAREMRFQQLGIFKAKQEWAAMTPEERTADAVRSFG